MRILKSSNGSASLQDIVTVLTYILPRIIVALYLMTVIDSKVAASKHKTGTSRLPVIKDTNSSFTFQVGDRAVLKCAVQNLGSRTVVWRKTKDSHPLTVGLMTFDPAKRYDIEHVSEKGEWNLFIKNISHDDAGIYECQISTTERYIRRLIQVIVKDREYKIPAITIHGSASVAKGKTLSLECNVTGGKQAPDDIDWLKDNHKLTSNKSGRINLTKHISGITLSTASNLTIHPMTPEDSGVYTCRTTGMAKNISVDVSNMPDKRGATVDGPVTSGAANIVKVHFIFSTLSVPCSSIIWIDTTLLKSLVIAYLTMYIVSITNIMR